MRWSQSIVSRVLASSGSQRGEQFIEEEADAYQSTYAHGDVRSAVHQCAGTRGRGPAVRDRRSACAVQSAAWRPRAAGCAVTTAGDGRSWDDGWAWTDGQWGGYGPRGGYGRGGYGPMGGQYRRGGYGPMGGQYRRGGYGPMGGYGPRSGYGPMGARGTPSGRTGPQAGSMARPSQSR
jgi:hypothetical protein